MTIAPDSEELLIKTGGKTLGGWTEFEVTRGVEQLPSGFAIALTERNPGQASKAVVTPFSTCEVFLGRDKILTGFDDLRHNEVALADSGAFCIRNPAQLSKAFLRQVLR